MDMDLLVVMSGGGGNATAEGIAGTLTEAGWDVRSVVIQNNTGHETGRWDAPTVQRPKRTIRLPGSWPDLPCACEGHRLPGVRHVAPCCDEPHIDQKPDWRAD
jgi:hypothetical protein